MGIEEEQVMPLILEVVPEFHDEWNHHLEEWRGSRRTVGIDLAAFSGFVAGKNESMSEAQLNVVFNLIERMLVEGTEKVRKAASTQLLENILNIYSHSDAGYPPSRLVACLGPESRKFCRAWDEFTGHQTPGL